MQSAKLFYYIPHAVFKEMIISSFQLASCPVLSSYDGDGLPKLERGLVLIIYDFGAF
jgi:hypothetical protein